MKMILASLLAVLTSAAVFASDGVPLFNATLAVGKEHRFVLVNESGKASPFLRIGESFEGFTLADYDAKTGLLGLERDGRITRVSLVTDATIAHSNAMTPATIADAQALLTAMNFDVMMEKMLAQSRKTQLGIVDQMMGQMARNETDKEAMMKLQTRLMDEILGVLKPAELKTDMARIYSELFTKEELNTLGAFYATPMGQKLNDLQPEIQQKLNAVMMPRIMGVMPRIKQITQEFAAEQRAKRAAAEGAQTPATATPAAKP